MNKVFGIVLVLVVMSCKRKNKQLTAQQIVDKSITICGGDLYEHSIVSFDFRELKYVSEYRGSQKILKRILENDTISLVDILYTSSFERYRNDSLVVVADSMAVKYANSVNSVHYFSKLPFGLNDNAVYKELMGETIIENVPYFMVKVTFDQEGGGKDFDDTYIYFFSKTTFKPDYLAYDYHTDGGGVRFRKAYNERYINGIRFVDYLNMKPTKANTPILKIDSLFRQGALTKVSKIELKQITVSR